ncbi:MAG: Hsp20/alpha crystallin family protein [Candidatus Binatia bacterium]
MVIRGGKKQSGKKEQRGYYHLEENQTAFAHALSLPCEVERDRVKARYKNGLSTVALPKRERACSRSIKIPVHT